MTDSQLLDDFVTGRDQAAFRALVVRHGPTILRVCRCVLHDLHEAEDAFQATFLVLIRKAPSIRDPELLGNWLHGVAYRIAARARRRAARRRENEKQRAEMLPAEGTPDRTGHELRRVLREELDRLPEAYREPLALCYLEGLTHEQAARRLGWPLGTVKVRLVRARRLLRSRLDRRGIASGIALILLFLPRKTSAAVPDALLESTVEAMRRVAAGGTRAPGARFARATALADDLLGAGLGVRRHWAVLALLGALLFATGGAVLAHQGRAVRDDEAIALPANLTNVLLVECR